MDGYLEEAFARECITVYAEAQAMIQAMMELGPATLAEILGTMNIPEPIVPPNPNAINSNRPSDFLYFFIGILSLSIDFPFNSTNLIQHYILNIKFKLENVIIMNNLLAIWAI